MFEISQWSKRSSENYGSNNPFQVDVKANLIIHITGIVNATPNGGPPKGRARHWPQTQKQGRWQLQCLGQ